MNKKIMLIDPYFKEGLKGFPLGLAYIAGALLRIGKYDVSVIDLTARAEIEKKDPEEILADKLLEIRPDIVGITSTSPTHKNACEAAKQIKKIIDIPIIKGGPHETNCAETTIRKHSEIDYSVVGQGEETIVELVDAVLNNGTIKGIRGVVYRQGNRIVNNGKRPLTLDLDTLPKPARNLFYLDKRFIRHYSADLFDGEKSTSVATSRGCPHSCSFCSSKAIWNGLRLRSVEGVVKELEELCSQGFRGFMFEDDMFIADKNWFLKFVRQIKEKGLDIEYSGQTRVDMIDEDVAKALSNSGCKLLYLGIESGVQDILDKCGKKITIEQAKHAFRILREHRIRNMASIQFGLPGEDLENLSTIKETMRILSEELRPDEVAISYTCLYPGSPLANQQGVSAEMYEDYISTQADRTIYTKTAHGTHSIHLKELTPEKILEIENLLDRKLKIKRFNVNRFYKT